MDNKKSQKINLNQIRSQTVFYKDLNQQYSNRKKAFYENIKLQNNQKTVIVGTNYAKGTKTLKVILNGMILTEGQDYIELDGKSIEFNEPLEEMDDLVFIIEGSGGGTTLEDTIHIQEFPRDLNDGINVEFNLNYVPERGSEEVFINGILLSQGYQEDYIINNKKLIFYEAPPIGSKIKICYRPIVTQFL